MIKKNVKYTNNYFETVNTLSPINVQFMFEKKDGQVKLRGNNDSGNCLFILKAPKDNFDFAEDKDESTLCMLDYTKFYKFYKEFDNVDEKDNNNSEQAVLDVAVNENTDEPVLMDISSNKTKCNFKYCLANTDVIKKPIIKENPKMPEFVTSIKLSKDVVNLLMHRIGMVDANFINFTLNGDICTFTGKNNVTMQEYSENIKLETPVDKTINVIVKADAFKLLPTADYDVYFSEQHLIKYEQKRDDELDLTLFMTTVKEG